MARVLFIFVDGLGLGEADAAVNPLVAARLPALEALLDGARPLRDATPRHARRASLVGLDATLGVPGLPQSGTGQAALLTGENAARIFGRHFGPWTPTALRPLVSERSVLARAVAAGHSVAFANAYPEEAVGKPRPELGDVAAAEPAAERTAAGGATLRGTPGAVPRARSPLRAAPPLAALAAGLLTRHTPELARGDAVASEITNEAWRERLGRLELPVITAGQAGRNLARIAAAHDLTLFAHYATDTIGHRGGYDEAVAALERLDAFLGGVLDALPADTLLVLASDHGNLEDVRGGHTYNPALGLVAGPRHAERAQRLHGLTDVAGVVLEAL